MYQKLSYKITDSLIEKNIVAEEDKIVYRYSIETGDISGNICAILSECIFL